MAQIKLRFTGKASTRKQERTTFCPMRVLRFRMRDPLQRKVRHVLPREETPMRRIFMAGSVLLFLAGMGIYDSTASASVPPQTSSIRYTRSGYGAQLATDGRGLVEV